MHDCWFVVVHGDGFDQRDRLHLHGEGDQRCWRLCCVRDVVDGTLQTFADEGLLQRLRADAASRATQGTLEIELTTESDDDAGEVWLRKR